MSKTFLYETIILESFNLGISTFSRLKRDFGLFCLRLLFYEKETVDPW